MTAAAQLLAPPPGPTREVLGVTVVEDEVPERWDGAVQTDQVVADPDRVLVWHRDAALYVANGSQVVIQTHSAQHRLDHDYLVYSLASRILLRQRRRFSLHATMVVSPEGRAVAITGDSMVGKSTTTVELMRRGWRFVCDDVLEVSVTGDGVVAVPFERPIHLSDASARLLGADPGIGRELPSRDKRVFSLAGDLQRRPLSGILRLRLGETDRVSSAPLSPLALLPVIAGHSDPLGTCQHPALRADYLSWCAAVASCAPACDLVRPRIGSSVEQLVDAVVAWTEGLPDDRQRAVEDR